MATDRLIADARRLREDFVGSRGYGLAYGSHAYSHSSTDSDLDLLFVGPALLSGRLDELVRAVIALHRKHALRLDVEVAHEVKLHATEVDVRRALALRSFTITDVGALYIQPVVPEPWFLNSSAFKLRLVLNALTTPHLLLGGDTDEYRQHRAAAERSVALIGLSLLDERRFFTLPDAAAPLVGEADGATGEDFLGYQNTPALLAMLSRGVTLLIREGVVRPAGEGRFMQRITMRQQLVAALARSEP